MMRAVFAPLEDHENCLKLRAIAHGNRLRALDVVLIRLESAVKRIVGGVQDCGMSFLTDCCANGPAEAANRQPGANPLTLIVIEISLATIRLILRSGGRNCGFGRYRINVGSHSSSK